jgi:hypothetical protein
MSSKLVSAALGALVLTFVIGEDANAGVYADDLAKCLVENTTEADRAGLVKWMFSAIVVHPVVQEIASSRPGAMEAANKEVGALVTRLLTVSCEQETRKAMKYEGTSTLQTSFKVLGEVAGQQIFGHPDVARAMARISEHMDSAKFESLHNSVAPEK